MERSQLIAELLNRLHRYERGAADEKQFGVAVQAVITAAKLTQIIK